MYSSQYIRQTVITLLLTMYNVHVYEIYGNTMFSISKCTAVKYVWLLPRQYQAHI